MIYAYYDGIDKIAHERGFGPYYDAELRSADDIVEQVRAQLVDGAALLVTADHGQVDVGRQRRRAVRRRVEAHPQSLGRRTLPLVARAARCRRRSVGSCDRSAHGDVAWVMSRQEMIEDGWFGPVVSPPVAARLGDVALVPKVPDQLRRFRRQRSVSVGVSTWVTDIC